LANAKRVIFYFITIIAPNLSVLSANANVNDYNLVCASTHAQRGQIYLNTYTMSVGARLASDGGFLADLETVNISPVNSCRNCYDITAATRSRDHVYIAKIRTSSCMRATKCEVDALSYSAALYETIGDSYDEQQLVVERSACAPNAPHVP
jgi:hypothetical protein